MARRLRTAAVVLLAAIGVVAVPSVAAAHGDEGELTVLSATAGTDASGAPTIHLEVDLTYENDGEHAGAATVVAVLRGPDGSTTPPAAVPHQSGQSKYAADLAVPGPGSWTVELTATAPDATATTTVEVAPPTTTTPTTTTEPSAGVTSSAVVDAAVSERAATARREDDGDDDGNGGVVAAAAIAAAVLAAALVIGTRRRRD